MSFVMFGKEFIQILGDNQLQHSVAKEFQTLIRS